MDGSKIFIAGQKRRHTQRRAQNLFSPDRFGSWFCTMIWAICGRTQCSLEVGNWQWAVCILPKPGLIIFAPWLLLDQMCLAKTWQGWTDWIWARFALNRCVKNKYPLLWYPNEHAGSDLEAFWLQPVTAITASMQPESGQIVYAGSNFLIWFCSSEEGPDHIVPVRRIIEDCICCVL